MICGLSWLLYYLCNLFNSKRKRRKRVNDIKITVNLVVFSIAVAVWVILGAFKLAGQGLDSDLAFLFAALTGVVLTIVQGFEKGVTFTSKGATIEKTDTVNVGSIIGMIHILGGAVEKGSISF